MTLAKGLKIATLIITLFSLFACNKENKFYYTSGTTHTYFRITYEYNQSLDNEIYDLFRSYYHSINPFDSTSVISQVNRNEDIAVDSIFIKAFLKSQYISQITDGYFDITCSPLINYWGFGFDKSLNEQTNVDSLLQLVGYNKIRLEGDKVIKKYPQMTINFSAIGDGYICDIIGNYFDSLQVMNYMIDVGGEVLVKGHNRQGEKWKIGITKPADDTDQQVIFKVIETDKRLGIATSGNYRNYYIKDGKKYAHTINPFTGMPSTQDILSVTIVCNECTLADGIATAVMTMGRDELKKYKERLSFIEYLIIFSDENGEYQIEASDGMSCC